MDAEPSGRVGRDRLDSEALGSNPAQGMDVCPRLFIITCHPIIDTIICLLRKRRKINYQKDGRYLIDIKIGITIKTSWEPG
jgi:hypothetical protein